MVKRSGISTWWIIVIIVAAILAVFAYSRFSRSEGYSTKDPDDLGSALSRSGKTFAYFYSPSCKWCDKMHPVYDSIKGSDKYKDMSFVKIDASQNKDLVNQYKVEGYPHIIFFKGSDVVGNSSGYVDEKTLSGKMIESYTAGLPISQNPTQKY